MPVTRLLLLLLLLPSYAIAQNIEPCWGEGEIPPDRNWCIEDDGTIRIRPSGLVTTDHYTISSSSETLYSSPSPERNSKLAEVEKEKPEPTKATLSAGAMGSFIAEEYTVSYAAQLHVDNPLALGSFKSLRLRSYLTVGLLPDGSLAKPDTFNSIEFETGPSLRIGKIGSHWTSLRAKAGFATIRNSKKSPNWIGGGVIVEDRRKKNFISVDILADQRPDGAYQPTIEVSGGIKVPLNKLINTDKINAYLVGNSVRVVVNYGTGVQMQTRIGVMLSI